MHHDPFGLPGPGQHGHHPVADSEARGAGAEGDHLAGCFEAGDVDRHARGRRVEAGPLQQVGVADACRLHVDEHLAEARLGIRLLTPLDATVDDGDRSHARCAQARSAMAT